MQSRKPYTMFKFYNGKQIGSVWADCIDDQAALEHARMHLRASPANVLHLHRGPPFYPLGERIAELKKYGPYDDIIESGEAA